MFNFKVGGGYLSCFSRLGKQIESQLGSFPAACGELYLAMNVSLRSKHQAPKGADIHFPVNKTVSSGLAKADLSNVRI
jgi:hypothetical protein